MSDTIGWGILGTGKVARILARAVTKSSTGELIAVGSRSGERAERFAAAFPVRRCCADYRAVIEDPQVDLVYVATHHPQHRVCATAAADGGKHVLCEKPLAVHHDDAKAIVEAARRNGVFLLEAFAYRSHPQTHQLVELLRSGAIGEIRMIDAQFGYDAGPSPATYVLVHALGGGSILDVGCYTTSMAHLIARISSGGTVAEPIDVTGAANIATSTGVDHSAAATLLFGGGLLARLACSVQVDLESSLRISGDAGHLTVRSPWLPGRLGKSAEIVLEPDDMEPQLIEIGLDADVYTIEVDAVARYVREGERSPSVMPWEESLANMRTLDRWRAAIGLIYEGEP